MWTIRDVGQRGRSGFEGGAPQKELHPFSLRWRMGAAFFLVVSVSGGVGLGLRARREAETERTRQEAERAAAELRRWFPPPTQLRLQYHDSDSDTRETRVENWTRRGVIDGREVYEVERRNSYSDGEQDGSPTEQRAFGLEGYSIIAEKQDDNGAFVRWDRPVLELPVHLADGLT